MKETLQWPPMENSNVVLCNCVALWDGPPHVCDSVTGWVVRPAHQPWSCALKPSSMNHMVGVAVRQTVLLHSTPSGVSGLHLPCQIQPESLVQDVLSSTPAWGSGDVCVPVTQCVVWLSSGGVLRCAVPNRTLKHVVTTHDAYRALQAAQDLL